MGIWGIERRSPLSLLSFAGILALGGCNAITGLSDFSIGAADGGTGGGGQGGGIGTGGSGGDTGDASDAAPPECTTNNECTTRASLDNPANPIAAVCLKPEGKCAKLLSDHCPTITGDYTNNDAILIGSLFATSPTGSNGTTNSTATTNQQRQTGAIMAIVEINQGGGIPAAGSGGNFRPLVMISCDAFSDMLSAAGHLINDLHVPAIVGPNTSQDTIDLTTKLSAQAGTALVSPSAVAASIVQLPDNNLTWLMVPTDAQRAPLMIDQIGVLETQIRARNVSMSLPQSTPVKLSIIYRNDALGVGTRVSLDPLMINGKPISDSTNLTSYVKIAPYTPTAADQNALVTDQVAFKPDIVVLAGTAEAVDKVLVPLEAQWQASTRPYYVMIDSNKVTSLLDATKPDATKPLNTDLRLRIRGTGVTPASGSAAALGRFNSAYAANNNNMFPSNSSIGTSYDATYAIAYSLAAMSDMPLSGANVAAGLRRLWGGPTQILTGDVSKAFLPLAAGESISARGTFAPLSWDMNGAIQGGAIEIWCIGATAAGAAVFQSSGLTYDLEMNTKVGSYTQCGPTQ